MEARIEYLNGYLYCNVDCQVDNYCDTYNSSEECLNEITPEIILDAKDKNYSEVEIEKIISWYHTVFSNSSVLWHKKF